MFLISVLLRSEISAHFILFELLLSLLSFSPRELNLFSVFSLSSLFP
jgi:hypothetical protein